MGLPLGVTRHQLLVDERILYTSHNSSLCLALESTAGLHEVSAIARYFLVRNCAGGSDPGLCIARSEAVPYSVTEFGRKAQREIITKSAALELAARHAILLEELGGTGGGVIGALAAVGLRAAGCDGRFVDLPGIRALTENELPARAILSRTSIQAVLDEKGESIPPDDIVHFGGWLRPNLRGGVPVLLVRQRDGASATSDVRAPAPERGWVIAERKHKNIDAS
ncbi:MAG: hypothetical protein HYX94_13445 [Chloroflexi bacterium]|nr:hypothetical protein [Chloroflexota bacterium]